MKLVKFFTSNKEEIIIDRSKVLGQGGEGKIYHLYNSQGRYKDDYCAKIYLPNILNNPNLINSRENKIKHIIQSKVGLYKGNLRICSPVDMLYNEYGKFIGFIMMKSFPDSDTLEWIAPAGYDLSSIAKIYPKFKKFSSSSENDKEAMITSRLKLLYNIAELLKYLHTNNYVLGDVKPVNILITSSGKVSLIDFDSVQILSANGKLLFGASACSQHYKPPEGYNKGFQLGKSILSSSWDCFSFSVIAYQLLIGKHPYSGTFRFPYNEGDDLMYKIKSKLFINGKNAKVYLKYPETLGLYMQRWNELNEELKDLFCRTFEYSANRRPSMDDWCNGLSKVINKRESPIKKILGRFIIY